MNSRHAPPEEQTELQQYWLIVCPQRSGSKQVLKVNYKGDEYIPRHPQYETNIATPCEEEGIESGCVFEE